MNKIKLIRYTILRFMVLILLGSSYGVVYAQDNMNHHNSQHTQKSYEDGVKSIDIKYVDGVIHLLQGKQQGLMNSIWYQSSRDQGKSWSQAVKVLSSEDIKFKRGNDARLAVQGNNIVAVWMTKDDGAPHNAGPMMAMRSNDNGQTWQKAAMPADWHGAHGFFAMDGNKNVINVVWLDSREPIAKGSQGLRFSQTGDGGLTWSTNKTLDQQTCACCWNTVKLDQQGNFYVLYRDKEPSDMALGSLNPDLNWQRINTVGQFNWDFQGCPHIGGGFAIDEQKQIFHATVSTGHSEHTGLYYLSSPDKGKSWSPPIQLGDSLAVHSDIALSDDDVVVVWDRITENGMQVVYSRLRDGVWSEIALMSNSELNATHPKIIKMADNFLVLWTESNGQQPSTLQTVILE